MHSTLISDMPLGPRQNEGKRTLDSGTTILQDASFSLRSHKRKARQKSKQAAEKPSNRGVCSAVTGQRSAEKAAGRLGLCLLGV